MLAISRPFYFSPAFAMASVFHKLQFRMMIVSLFHLREIPLSVFHSVVF